MRTQTENTERETQSDFRIMPIFTFVPLVSKQISTVMVKNESTATATAAAAMQNRASIYMIAASDGVATAMESYNK